ncbi:hypothetical protein BJY14_005533 [Actinomadura luteofluorescens]|uniref:DUF3068 domain-containing protein n=1 Tax=Actinomadura luteofluorescens TaxID=46163 RepID=A0A7Y9ELW9_9ACTN|nr:DUF3068 domain-containing protein [Actinomadura luteofluorescens]NYD49550.1 hypothetical protein [Actinomadura luteofluorescens]
MLEAGPGGSARPPPAVRATAAPEVFMRRPVGLVLIGLGAFFLTLAPLVRFYVADQVVVAPLNRYQVTNLESKDSTYFDEADVKLKTGVTLLAKNTVRGDVRANEGNDDIAVWDSTTNIYNQAKPDKPVQIQGYRIAFDRRTGVLTNCCGANVDGDNGVRMVGYGLLFPIANVQKKDYPFYDMTTRQTAPMQFNAVEKVHGLTTYRFTQTIPLTKTASLDAKLPAKMLGLPKDAGNQKVDRYTEAYNTVWVDPRTGIPVKHRENIRSTVRTSDGRGSMIVAQADLITVDRDQRGLVDMANSTALQIDMVRSYVPATGVLLGLILLFVGGYLGMGRREAPPLEAPRRPDGKFGDMTAPGPPRPSGPPGPSKPSAVPTESAAPVVPSAGPPESRRPAPLSQRQQRRAAGPAKRR